MSEFLYGAWSNGSNCPIAEATGESEYDSISEYNMMAGLYDKYVRMLLDLDNIYEGSGTVNEELAREAWFLAIDELEGDNGRRLADDAAKLGREVAETLGWS